MTFLAKRCRTGYRLLENGRYFGSLYFDGSVVTGGSFKDERVTDCFRRLMLAGNGVQSVRDCLALARRAAEIVDEDDAAEAKAEIEAENAWLRAAEMPTLEDMAFEDWERGRGCY